MWINKHEINWQLKNRCVSFAVCFDLTQKIINPRLKNDNWLITIYF